MVSVILNLVSRNKSWNIFHPTENRNQNAFPSWNKLQHHHLIVSPTVTGPGIKSVPGVGCQSEDHMTLMAMCDPEGAGESMVW